MGYLKERLKHVIRFRHKRGYGVHSPFMFNLILNVIRDKEKQFVYPEALEKFGMLKAVVVAFDSLFAGASGCLSWLLC